MSYGGVGDQTWLLSGPNWPTQLDLPFPTSNQKPRSARDPIDDAQLKAAASVPKDAGPDPFDPVEIRKLAIQVSEEAYKVAKQAVDSGTTQAVRGDLKAGRAGVKVPLHWVPLWALEGVARVFDYGARKYAPGNWMLARTETTRAALDDYLSAQLRHVADAQQPGANDETLLTDMAKLDGESGLPHIDHMICGLIMLRGIMTLRGLLPRDPGRGVEPAARGLGSSTDRSGT